ncbi:MAG: PLP-dependent aminotransferase family protein [Polyangiaceae bacterium]|nr:PLP-dependent aminotransferase family protein [Polyangiaceae bacterium]
MHRPPYVSLNLRLNEPGRRAVARDLVQAIEREIHAGRLSAGLRLPPVRVLEHQLGISKNTVQAAYDELVARGLLDTRAREGVFVAESAAPNAQSKTKDIQPIGAAPPDFVPARFARREPTKNGASGVIQLSTVFIDPDLLPIAQLNDCFRAVLASKGLEPFYDAQGYPPLRHAIAERLKARGMDASPDDVIVTTGSQQGIDIVARSLRRRHIAAEDPVYSHAKFLFESFGAKLSGLPLSPFEDVPLDRWTEIIDRERPSLLYAITSFQNPTGHSYSTYELVQLLELSQHYSFPILEDDWGSDMLSGTEYRPTLRALGGPNVLYLNSFTKKLLPALRVGFVVASPEAKDSLVTAKRIGTLANATITEAVVFEFLERGYFDTHLKRLHDALDARYHACLEALRDTMPEGVRWSSPGGGPTLWLEMPRTVDLNALRERLAQKDVAIEDASGHFHGTPHLHGFRVGYAFLPEERLRQGLEKVAETLHEMGLREGAGNDQDGSARGDGGAEGGAVTSALSLATS